jgi:branched-chain amino acid transport system substrate-binding protein
MQDPASHTGAAGTVPARRRVLAAAALTGVPWLLPRRVRAQGRPPQPLRIGLSGPYTGGSAPMGLSMRNGVRLAVRELNAMGGLLGRPVELVERDDQASPEVGGRIATELTQTERVVATVGIVNTGVGLTSIDTYQKARVPLLIAVSTGTVLTRRFAPPAAPENFIFRVAPTIENEARVLSEELLRRDWRTVALMADATPYGEAGKNDLEKALAARQIRLTGVERFAIGTQDMRAPLTRLRAARPQALLVWGIGPEMAAIARDRLALGWNVPLLGGWTFSMANFLDGAGPAGEGALMTQTFIQEGGLSNKNAFILSYAQLSGEQRMASPMSAAQGYDAMLLLAAAIRQANGTDGNAIRIALETLRQPVQGVITLHQQPFTPQDHDAISANMLMVGVVRNRRVTYAYAEDARRGIVGRSKEAR